MINTSCFNNKTVIKIWGILPKEVENISTDSRSINYKDLFLALKGEKFNGEDFVDSLIEKGIRYFVVSEDFPSKKIEEHLRKNADLNFIVVNDTLAFFQEASKIYLRNWRQVKKERKVFGITGSNGKTTTKDMLLHFMSGIMPNKVMGTQGNFNNHIGVPKTIFRLTENIDYLILEMGMNHSGELDVLLDIAPIDASIITNIGTAHIEHLKTKENIFIEKKKLFDYVDSHAERIGPVVLNFDDEYLSKIESKKVVSFGQANLKSNFVYKYSKNKVSILINKNEIVLENEEITGIHNFVNLIASFLFTLKLFPNSEDELIKLCKTFRPSKNRSFWLKKENKEYFLDAYNANPDSMKAALIGFSQNLEEKNIDPKEILYILGDMNELGDSKIEAHKEIGVLLTQLRAKNVVFIGSNTEFYNQGFSEKCFTFNSRDEFITSKKWKELNSRFRYFFIKASNSLGLEKLIDNV